VNAAQQDLDPAFAAMIDAVEGFRACWPGPGPITPHAVAHQDPTTGTVTFHLRGLPDQFDYLCAGTAAIAAAGTGADPDLMTREQLIAEVLSLRGALATARGHIPLSPTRRPQ
jgi:hypothetical protein